MALDRIAARTDAEWIEVLSAITDGDVRRAAAAIAWWDLGVEALRPALDGCRPDAAVRSDALIAALIAIGYPEVFARKRGVQPKSEFVDHSARMRSLRKARGVRS